MNQTRREKTKILLIEDDQGLCELLQEEIEDAGYKAQVAHTAESGLEKARTWMPDLIVSDLRLPGASGLALLQKLKTEVPQNTPDVLIITAFGSVADAVQSLKAGAEDFLTKPLDLEHFRLTIKRIIEKRRMRDEIKKMKTLIAPEGAFHGMHGRSRSMQILFQQIQQVAKATGPVLIAGESGTGKELVARAIHKESKVAKNSFLAVNCAGIPEHLLESEFFGHEAGSFTGAGKARQGLCVEADGGTLLLDEIAEMPMSLQAKLLRVLQDGKIRPVGANKEQQVNVRILAATNQNLEQLVNENKFRKDLFYRLETLPLMVPPLRDRDEDILFLAEIFLKRHAFVAEKPIKGFSESALEMLQRYHFPGNVRELQNSIERAVVFCNTNEILPLHLPRRIQKNLGGNSQLANDFLKNNLIIDDNSLPSLKEVEGRYIRHVLEKVNGNKRMASSILGIARRTLYRWLEENGMPDNNNEKSPAPPVQTT